MPSISLRGGLIAAVLLLARNADAQEARLSGEASHTLRPPVSLDGVPGAEVGVSTVQAGVAAQFSAGPRTFLTPGISYQGQFLRYAGMPSAHGPEELHTLETSLMLFHMLNDTWSVVGRGSVGLSGDFAGLDRHLRLGATALAMRRFSPAFAAGLGAGFAYGDGEWRPWPVARVDWQASEHLKVEALLPVSTKALYRFGDRWELGTLVQLEGARWAVEGEAQDSSIDYLSIDAGALLGIRIAGDAWMTVLAGWNVYQQYEVDGGPRDGDYDPDRGLLLRAGLELRLPGG